MKPKKKIYQYIPVMVGVLLLLFIPILISTISENGFIRKHIRLLKSNPSEFLYLEYILCLSVVFFIIFILGYYFFIKKSVKLSFITEKKAIIGFIIIGFILRLVLANLVYGHPYDTECFTSWTLGVSKNFFKFYVTSGSPDYPPLYMYILFLIGKLNNIIFLKDHLIILIKLPAIISDLISTYLIYKISKKYISIELSAFISLFYLFNPAIIINSSLWAQVDSIFSLLIVAAVYFIIEGNLKLSSVLFTLSVLMKPQGIIFLPVMFFELVRRKKLKNFAIVIGIGLVVAFAVIIPFNAHRNLIWIFELYKHTVSEYPYATMNAFNLFYLLNGNFLNDSKNLFILSYHSIGMLFIVGTTLFSWFIYHKGNNVKYSFLSALIQISGVFTFAVGMHERYLYPAVILCIFSFIYLKDKRFLILILGFSITSYLNTHYILFKELGGNITPERMNQIGNAVSILNLVWALLLVKIAVDNVLKERKGATILEPSILFNEI